TRVLPFLGGQGALFEGLGGFLFDADTPSKRVNGGGTRLHKVAPLPEITPLRSHSHATEHTARPYGRRGGVWGGATMPGASTAPVAPLSHAQGTTARASKARLPRATAGVAGGLSSTGWVAYGDGLFMHSHSDVERARL